MLRDKGIKECLIEGDSSSNVSWGLGKSQGPWLLNHLVSEVVRELQVDLLQVPRCQNSSTDKLAKWGVNLPERHMGNSLPNC